MFEVKKNYLNLDYCEIKNCTLKQAQDTVLKSNYLKGFTYTYKNDDTLINKTYFHSKINDNLNLSKKNYEFDKLFYDLWIKREVYNKEYWEKNLVWTYQNL